MADPSFNAKARTIASLTAKATVDLMQNRGLGLNVNEVRSVLEAVDSDASEFFCKGCGHPLSSDEVKGSRCGVCGSRQATDAPVYRCASCKQPISIKAKSCPHCGCKDAIKSNSRTVLAVGKNPRSTPRFSCSSCLRPIPSLDAFPTCPGCGSETAWKNVEV